ncbi:phytoene desaturase family protein [Actinomadura fibrosa]|uniref:phytoene desaturase family protein n=1 Tax=Actinomadura fibrosa TaxID=111802 RepID=UPI0010418BF6|nr:NAD(P)/FAD-dependent oxidoreductase [Actinomadura fibrosa]
MDEMTLLRAAGPGGLAAVARDTVTSGRAYTRREFTGPEVDHLWAPWLLHAGLGPDHASGGLMLQMLATTLHGDGLPVVAGGAGRFVAAFTGLLDEAGVTVLPGTRVEHVLIERGRAAGVTSGATVLRARDAVLCSVTPEALYGGLLPAAAVPPRVRAEARRHRSGRAALHLHVALAGPVPWRDARLAAVPLVHLTDGAASTAIACAEAEARLLPARPTVGVGQQHVLDPSRVPPGRAALWLQLQELPYEPLADAAGEIDVRGGWDEASLEAYAERVLARVETHAPGLRGLVVGTRVLGPRDLEAANANAVRGDPYGGSTELDQNLLWRPGPLMNRHRTAVPGLWHIGASTHPGPGMSGASGLHAADRILARPRWHRRTNR